MAKPRQGTTKVRIEGTTKTPGGSTTGQRITIKKIPTKIGPTPVGGGGQTRPGPDNSVIMHSTNNMT